jgi:soluble lytic murein transglycosylase
VAEGRKRRLDPVFLCAVIERESRFIPTKVGSHGEIGLMQIRPATGEWIARKYLLPWHGAETLRDPVSNIRIGAAYFAFLRQSFKSRGQLYLSAYNLGPKKTRDKVGQQIWPKEYFSQVMRNFLHYHRQVSRFSAKYAALDR